MWARWAKKVEPVRTRKGPLRTRGLDTVPKAPVACEASVPIGSDFGLVGEVWSRLGELGSGVEALEWKEKSSSGKREELLP